MTKKVSRLGKNEVREVKIPREAIEEILWENLMENGDEWFDLKQNSDDICGTTPQLHQFWDVFPKRSLTKRCGVRIE